MPPKAANVQKEVIQEINKSAGGNDASKLREFDVKLLNQAKSLKELGTTLQNILNGALENITEPNIPLAVSALDFGLLSKFDDYQGFLRLLESASNQISIESISHLVGYLETRAPQTIPLNFGANTVLFLSTIKFMVDRVTSTANPLLVGRLLVIHALNKGHAHPSRLNKKSIKASTFTFDFDNDPEKLADHAEKFTPQYVIYRLVNMESFDENPELAGFFRRLERRFECFRRGFNHYRRSEDSIADPFLYGTEWSSADWGRSCDAKVIALIHLTIYKLWKSQGKWASHLCLYLENRLLTPVEITFLKSLEDLNSSWQKCKMEGFPEMKFEVPENEIEFPDVDLPKPTQDLPELTNLIGNSQLTPLLSEPLETEDFRILTETPPSPSNEFINLRQNSLKSAAEYFAENDLECPDLAEYEAKITNEQKRPLSNDQESAPEPKRTRVSYEDTASRRKAIEVTARPLPY